MKIRSVLTHWTGGTVLAGLSLISAPVFAQDVESVDNGVATPAPQETADTSARLPITVSVGGSEQFKTDIDNNKGSFSVARGKVGVSAPVRLNEDWTLGTTFRYQLDSYDFNNVAAPWHNINTLSLASIVQWRAMDSWSYYGGGFVRMSAETEESLGKGTTGGGLVGVNYRVNETLTVGGGLAVMSQIKDDATVLPLITAKWKFADNWRLDVGLTDLATLGYGADVKWLFSKDFDFTFGAQFHKSRFRINGSGPSQDGVGQESAGTLYADATWHAAPKFDVGGFVGVVVGGQLRLENSSGNELGQNDYKPAALLGLKGSVRF